MLAIIEAARDNRPQARQHLESARALLHPAEVDKMIASTEEKIATLTG